ncbi:MAG: AAA family ATPase, partial [Boseongicola sp.]|nr:AAA family ATPase [Boseongicola sp.]
MVLLLDEPGLSLHGKAQADLLRFFEERLAPHHQIIYSTHSPFMVPAAAFDRVRIVEDKVDDRRNRRMPLGTKVREDVLELDPDTLFPLQGALGYEITQSLFVGKHTLLVEGPSDVLYLQALSAALRTRHRVSLD